MRYSYEYKMMYVDLYHHGKCPEIPSKINDPKSFKEMVRFWAQLVEANGPMALKQGKQNQRTPD